MKCEKCPACQQLIVSYRILPKVIDYADESSLPEHLYKDALEKFGDGQLKQSIEQEFAGAVEHLDHAYFLEEIKKLLGLHRLVEQELLKRGQSWGISERHFTRDHHSSMQHKLRGVAMTSIEKDAMDSIRERALDLQYIC